MTRRALHGSRCGPRPTTAASSCRSRVNAPLLEQSRLVIDVDHGSSPRCRLSAGRMSYATQGVITGHVNPSGEESVHPFHYHNHDRTNPVAVVPVEAAGIGAGQIRHLFDGGTVIDQGETPAWRKRYGIASSIPAFLPMCARVRRTFNGSSAVPTARGRPGRCPASQDQLPDAWPSEDI